MKKKLPAFSGLVLLTALLLLLFSGAQAQNLISQGKTVTVSSTESASYPASYATDGNSGTRWSSSSTSYNEWLYVDLGTKYDLDSVQVDFADGRLALTFDIQATNTPADATSWVTIRTRQPTNTSSSVIVGGLYGEYRYVRFNGRGRANPLGYRISEFKVYGYPLPTSDQLANMSTVRARRFAEYATLPGDLTVLITSMLPNGKWPDPTPTPTPGQMNYSGNAWTSHSLRLALLARSYRDPTNVLYNNPTVVEKYMLGMRYFINQHFTSSNWHDTVVRSPQNIILSLMLMKGAIPKDSLYLYAFIVKDYTGNNGNQGVNRVWVSEIVADKGLTLDRYPQVNSGIQNMAAPLNIASWSAAEGVRADSAFHQHRYQLNIGSYGMDFIKDEVTFIHHLDGTIFSSIFTSTQRTNLRNMMLGGMQVFGYRGALDFGSMGRAVSGPGAITNIDGNILETQKLNDPSKTVNYQNWQNHMLGAAFPFTAAKHFWMTNILVSHGPNFYMSAKIMSARNKGTEAFSGANLKGYNLPFGATNIMTTGTEYFDIFPTWNWSRIPGTTAEMSEAQASTTFGLDTGYVTSSNTFGGGVSINEAGVTAYKHDNKRGVTARKAYFFMQNMMVCMGNSITATKTNEIVTTVNQTKSTGTITAFYNGSAQTFTSDSLTNNTLQWVHHDNVGYLFPYGGLMSLTNKTQTGTWRSINTGGSTTIQSTQMFNLYVRHSSAPVNRTYFYIVAPNKQLSDMATVASGHGFVRITNDANSQSIRSDAQPLNPQYAAVFYAAGTIDMGDGLIVKSDKPAIVFLKKYSTNYRISVADPEYTASPIKITVNKNLSGTGAVYASGETAITFSTFSGDDRGKTNTGFFTINSGSLMAAPGSSTLDAPLDSDKQQVNDGISIYPNPATTTIYVKGLTATANIDVYNLAGHKFSTVHGTQVDISALTPGVTYFLRIHTNGKVITRQFIKQ